MQESLLDDLNAPEPKSVSLPVSSFFGVLLILGFTALCGLLYRHGYDGLSIEIMSFGFWVNVAAVMFPLLGIYKIGEASRSLSLDENEQCFKVFPILFMTIMLSLGLIGFRVLIVDTYTYPVKLSSTEQVAVQVQEVKGLLSSTYRVDSGSGTFVIADDFMTSGKSFAIETRGSLDGRVHREYVCAGGMCSVILAKTP
jgi:hypothetical protein